MKIIKDIQKPIKKDCFFIECEIKNLHNNYFIKGIEQGINAESNRNYKTNVKGKMTSWFWFAKDPKFIDIVQTGIDYLDEHGPSLPPYFLKEAWGIKTGFRDKTVRHSHGAAVVSGVYYLNDNDQILYFPQLDLEIKPEKNKLIMFSAFLDHYTNLNKQKTEKYAIAFNLFEEKKDY
jgi:hypothetical protein|tara:strand:+ start:6715 stop:7245 length:531 start_codon:yes stop_codon:yes gene_type:complete